MSRRACKDATPLVILVKIIMFCDKNLFFIILCSVSQEFGINRMFRNIF